MSNDWLNAELHAERAQRFYQAGQWDQALAELKLALQFNPDHGDWHFGMGLTLDALQRYDEAIDAFKHVLRLRGDDVDAMLHLGVDLIRCGRYERAIEMLARVNDMQPGYEPAYAYRILAHAELGQHDEAELSFYLACQLDEVSATTYDHIAHSLALRSELDRAEWCWRRALDLDPNYPEIYLNLARIERERGRHQRAHELYIQQLRSDPGDADTLIEVGTLLRQMSRPAEAGEKFRRALELTPNLPEARLHLGELALLGGHVDDAEAHLLAAANADCDMAGVYLGLAKIALQRSQFDAAREMLRAELTRDGRTTWQTLELARLLIELSLHAEAVDVMNDLLDVPNVPGVKPRGDDVLATAALYRGFAHLHLGELDYAVADFRRAVRHNPASTIAMHELVHIHLKRAQIRHARYWLGRARSAAPAHPRLRSLRVRVFRAAVADSLRHLGRKLRPVAR